MYDLIIKNGKIIDGTGNKWFKGDIAIEKGKIKKVGFIKDSAKKVIDAKGKIIAPGFIDLHSHGDLTVLNFPKSEGSISQGVTSIVGGNCGLTLAPLDEEKEDLLKSYVSPFLSKEEDLDWDWISFKEYYNKVEKNGHAVNFIPMVGHGTLRLAVKGFSSEKLTSVEMEEMKNILKNCMEEGAFGMSTGLVYPPGCYSDSEELIELGKVLKQFGGLYSTHMRSESTALVSSLKEAIKVGEENNIPVQVSHHKAKGEESWGKVNNTLEIMKKARERGVEVNCDVYPYLAGSTTITSILPTWVMDEGVEGMLKRLQDEKTRNKIKFQYIEDNVEGDNDLKDAGFKGIYIAACHKNEEYEGKSLYEIIKQKNKIDEPYKAFFDLLIEIEGEATVIKFFINENDVREVISSSLSAIASDSVLVPKEAKGKPHPRTYGTFPKAIRKYYREEGILRLEEVIRKMTSLPASILRLKNRGLIKEGFWADIVIFDKDKIKDCATYQEPWKKPEGINYVLVNGKLAVKDGKLLETKAGQVIYNEK